MGVEQDAWTGFKTQVQADVALDAFVTTFKFNKQEEVLDESAFPLFQAFFSDTAEDNFEGVPKQKRVDLLIEVHMKVWLRTDQDTLYDDILEFDEKAKNAIESDLQFSGNITLAKVGETAFDQLDDNIMEGVFSIALTTKRFLAGSR